MRFIGVDPGASGGLAVLSPQGHPLSVTAMPATERDVADWIAENAGHSPVALIEKVGAMPKQGVSSTFKFGQNYGFLRGTLVSHQIAFDEVTPRTWQKVFVPAKGKNETKTQHKNRLKQKAQQLFPQVRVTLKTADALLIAEYARRQRERK